MMVLPQIETITPELDLIPGRAKQEDLAVILDVLIERDDPLTLENANLVLFVGLRNRPDAWTITAEELAEMWAEQVEKVAG